MIQSMLMRKQIPAYQRFVLRTSTTTSHILPQRAPQHDGVFDRSPVIPPPPPNLQMQISLQSSPFPGNPQLTAFDNTGLENSGNTAGLYSRARGRGADDMLLTAAGLWIASDNLQGSAMCGGASGHAGLCFLPYS